MTRPNGSDLLLFAAGIAGLVLLTVFICATAPDKCILAYGAALQIISVGIVVYGFLGTINVFAPTRLRDSLDQLLAVIKRPVSGSLNATEVGLDGFTLSATAGRVDAHQTTEEKVDMLQARVDALNEHFSKVVKGLREQSAERVGQIERAAQALRSDIEQAFVGKPWVALFGFACLAVGIAVSIVPSFR